VGCLWRVVKEKDRREWPADKDRTIYVVLQRIGFLALFTACTGCTETSAKSRAAAAQGSSTSKSSAAATAPPRDPGHLGTPRAAPGPTATGSAFPEVPQPSIAATSDDGKRVLFLRAGDLYIADRDLASEDLLVRGDGTLCIPSRDGAGARAATGSFPEGCLILGSFFNIEFHPDGQRAFFSVAPGRGEVICTVDLKSKRVKRLAWAFGYQHILIRTGRYRGHLLLANALTSGRYFRCMLVSGTTGKAIRDVEDLAPGCQDSPEIRQALGF